jgi:hypothetical protein
MLVELKASMTVAKAVNLLKSNSSQWLKQQGINFPAKKDAALSL